MSKKELEVHADDIRPGDTVKAVIGFPARNFRVEREVHDPEPGFGTAIVNGQRYRGFMTQSRGFYYLAEDGRQEEARVPSYRPWSDFIPEEEKKAPTLPTVGRVATAIAEGRPPHLLAADVHDGINVYYAADRVLDLLRREGF